MRKYLYLCYNYCYVIINTYYGMYVCMSILWNLHFTCVSITFIVDCLTYVLVLCRLKQLDGRCVVIADKKQKLIKEQLSTPSKKYVYD